MDKNQRNAVVGAQLRRIRHEKGMKIVELARALASLDGDESTVRVQSCRVMISRWEHGAQGISLKHAKMLAKSLGVTMEELLDV